MAVVLHQIEQPKQNDLKVLYNSNNSIIQNDISKKDDVISDKYIKDDKKSVGDIENVEDVFSKPSESIIIDTSIDNANLSNKLENENKKRIVEEKDKNILRAEDIAKKAKEEAERKEKKAKEEAERKKQEKLKLESEKKQINIKEHDLIKGKILDLKKIKGKKIKVELTGFCDPETASGVKPHNGTIAVPYEIDFGTRIYIPGYGVCVSEDRGGAIKLKKDGTYKIDIWRPTEKLANDVGLVQTEAYILD